MNNTFCLAIFLALVYFRQLEWKFSAEVTAILAAEASPIVPVNPAHSFPPTPSPSPSPSRVAMMPLCRWSRA